MRHSDAHFTPFLGAGQRRPHAYVGAARAQMMHLPAEDFFDAETDDVTAVDQFVEWNAGVAVPDSVQPGSGQSR